MIFRPPIIAIEIVIVNGDKLAVRIINNPLPLRYKDATTSCQNTHRSTDYIDAFHARKRRERLSVATVEPQRLYGPLTSSPP